MADATKGLTKYTPLMKPLSVRPYCRNSYTPITTCGVSRTKTMAAISRIRTVLEVARRPVNKQCMNDINSIHLLIVLFSLLLVVFVFFGVFVRSEDRRCSLFFCCSFG